MPAEPGNVAPPRIAVTGVGSVSALGARDGPALGAALARSLPAIGPVQAFRTTAA